MGTAHIRSVAQGSLLVVALFALAACGKGENEPGPGGVTVGEARALDEAAQMLEERRAPVEELTTDASLLQENAAIPTSDADHNKASESE